MTNIESVNYLGAKIKIFTNGRLTLSPAELEKISKFLVVRGTDPLSMEGALIAFYIVVIDKFKCVNHQGRNNDALYEIAKILATLSFRVAAHQVDDVTQSIVTAIKNAGANGTLADEVVGLFLTDHESHEWLATIVKGTPLDTAGE